MYVRPAPLPRAFWLRLALPRAAAILAWTAVNALWQLPLAAALVLIGADALGFAWQFRQFQLSADEHVRDTGAMAPVWGGYLVLLFAGFATAALWWAAILIASRPAETESYAAQQARLRDAAYSLTLSANGAALRFEGEITFGLKARLDTLLKDNPGVRRIGLHSPGGHIFEARGAAQVILAHGLDTWAEGDCTSACTLLFAAGRERGLAAGARLGFHGYGLAEATHLPGYDVAGQQDKDRAYFQSRGIDPDFAARIFDTPSTAMWYPAAAELRAAGVVTE